GSRRRLPSLRPAAPSASTDSQRADGSSSRSSARNTGAPPWRLPPCSRLREGRVMRVSAANEPRERSAPAQRRARERAGESEGGSPASRLREGRVMRVSAANEPRERSAPAQRRARERAGESEGGSPASRL